MKKFLMSLLLVASLAGSAMAATYATKDFSANFNGVISVSEPNRNTDNTSTTITYSSSDATALEMVSVRFIDHDISVDTTSSDFYANSGLARTCPTNVATCRILDDRTAHGTYQGHPYTYTLIEMTYLTTNTKYWLRTRYIIVNSREAIFIDMLTLEGNSQESAGAWLNSLEIK